MRAHHLLLLLLLLLHVLVVMLVASQLLMHLSSCRRGRHRGHLHSCICSTLQLYGMGHRLGASQVGMLCHALRWCTRVAHLHDAGREGRGQGGTGQGWEGAQALLLLLHKHGLRGSMGTHARALEGRDGPGARVGVRALQSSSA